jgi:hypothetical protein
MHIPYQTGWLRGLNPVEQGPNGQVLLPAGDGPVWFWPAIPVVIVEILWLLAALIMAGSLFWKRSSGPRPGRPVFEALH